MGRGIIFTHKRIAQRRGRKSRLVSDRKIERTRDLEMIVLFERARVFFHSQLALMKRRMIIISSVNVHVRDGATVPVAFENYH